MEYVIFTLRVIRQDGPTKLSSSGLLRLFVHRWATTAVFSRCLCCGVGEICILFRLRPRWGDPSLSFVLSRSLGTRIFNIGLWHIFVCRLLFWFRPSAERHRTKRVLLHT
jgi:hypothetical protein